MYRYIRKLFRLNGHKDEIDMLKKEQVRHIDELTRQIKRMNRLLKKEVAYQIFKSSGGKL